MQKITETVIVNSVKDFLINKIDGNWHEDKVRQSKLHGHGPDLALVGGKRNREYFIIECKGCSYAKSAKSVNREGWIHALEQLVTRMNTARIIQTGKKRNYNSSL